MININTSCKSVLTKLKDRIKDQLKDNFIGAYIHGSFATGDPLPDSDIDIIIIIKKDINLKDITSFQLLHENLYATLEAPWGQRVELSYVPIEIFSESKTSPRDPIGELRSSSWKDSCTKFPPRNYPFWYLDNGAKNLVRSEHDNTQIVRWTVREKAIILEGPDPKNIMPIVTQDDLIKDLRYTFNIIYDKWANIESLNSLGMQTFFVTLCCRAQHCFHNGIVVSKKIATAWAKQNLSTKYNDLIESAYQHWKGDRSNLFNTSIDEQSVKLTIELIKETTKLLNR